MIKIFISLLFLAVATSQYCGRFTGDCTGFLSFGRRTVYSFGVVDNVVIEIRESHRYYLSSTCNDNPALITTAVYETEVNDTDIDYAGDYISHFSVVSDYLIVSSNVNVLSTLGVTCVPSLSNDVEVSLKRTVCTSSNGVIQGSDFLGSNTTFYVKFPSSKEVRISRFYPIIEPSSLKKLDNEGCVGCPSESIWSSAAIGYQVRGFCSETQHGYLYRSCIMGETGNGIWADELTSECADLEADPQLEVGEAFFHALLRIEIDPSEFVADQHFYMYEQLLEYVRANDLPTAALLMEQVKNVDTMESMGEKGKPVEVWFRVMGEKEKVKKTKSSVETIVEKGTLHRRMIAYDSRWFDAKIELGGEIEMTSKVNIGAIVAVCVVVVVVLVVVIGVIVWVVRRKRKQPAAMAVDVEKGAEESYSEDYSGYSYSEETESE
ncbi:uncharacterized protein [Blastocystis hominis]|uniref:Uncharacterized protein n=1 Tax=Blastocystis hominis TaxID=12968 RepID=D8M8R3_BLAHO|nr:uncharacterized protein [Blastocystis hominis]CBK24452.2 unnamed protein product [Blastocystis hominis]|eukprot:XP_012898500.1 uncharacterized protein [Blastocystis hominis]